jgi:hypothetical protein
MVRRLKALPAVTQIRTAAADLNFADAGDIGELVNVPNWVRNLFINDNSFRRG